MNPDEIEAWTPFRARFTPTRTDNLKPGVTEFIGMELIWEPLWIVDEEDGGPYVGEWACMATDDNPEPRPHLWVPSCDLTALVTADR